MHLCFHGPHDLLHSSQVCQAYNDNDDLTKYGSHQPR